MPAKKSHRFANANARYAQCMTENYIVRQCRVTGRVQGVFYRASAARRAAELGITGEARNLPDGSVEVLACGGEAAVSTLIEWLRVGPSAAKVTQVEVSQVAAPQPWPREFTTA